MYGYSAYENHVRLLEALQPPALRAVEGLLIHPNNVDLVMKQLEELYGRPDILAREIIEGVIHMPRVSLQREGTELTALSLEINNMVGHLAATSASSRLQDQTLLDQLVAKLPDHRREKWFRHLQDDLYEMGNVARFASWLEGEAAIVRRSHQATQFSLVPRPNGPTYRGVFAIEAKAEPLCQCPICLGNHILAECGQFADFSTDDRWEVVKRKSLCFACLGSGHSSRECRESRRCGIEGCNRRHHRILHEGQISRPEMIDSETNAIVHSGRCLYKYIMVNVQGPKGSQQVLAFIDEGSKTSLIEQKLADELGLMGSKRMINLKWIGGATQKYEGSLLEPKINNFVARGVLTVPELKLPEQELNSMNMADRFPKLRATPFAGYDRASPRILIGLGHSSLTRPQAVIQLDSLYTAIETRLGWIIYGGTEDSSEEDTGEMVDGSGELNERSESLDHGKDSEDRKPKKRRLPSLQIITPLSPVGTPDRAKGRPTTPAIRDNIVYCESKEARRFSSRTLIMKQKQLHTNFQNADTSTRDQPQTERQLGEDCNKPAQRKNVFKEDCKKGRVCLKDQVVSEMLKSENIPQSVWVRKIGDSNNKHDFPVQVAKLTKMDRGEDNVE